MTPDKKSVGDELYSGAATFGRVSAIMGAIFGTLVGLIMIPLGIYLLTKKVKLTASTVATIDTSDCVYDSASSTYRCTLGVKYTIDHVPYSSTITTSGSIDYYKEGETVRVHYDPSKPEDAALGSGKTNHTAGIVFIAVGVVIPLATWVWLYFANKYKEVAAVGGVATGLDMLSGGRL